MTRIHREVVKAKEDLTCNVIPLIDIMFLLLLFLMVGADMGRREWAELVLPSASHAAVPTEPDVDARDTRIVNVRFVGGEAGAIDVRGTRELDRWTYAVGGLDYSLDALRGLLADEAGVRREPGARGAQGGAEAGGHALSRLKIVVRADRAAPYGLVQRLLTTCGELGIYRVEVAANVPSLAVTSG